MSTEPSRRLCIQTLRAVLKSHRVLLPFREEACEPAMRLSAPLVMYCVLALAFAPNLPKEACDISLPLSLWIRHWVTWYALGFSLDSSDFPAELNSANAFQH